MEEPSGSSPFKIIAIIVSVLLVIVAGFILLQYINETRTERVVLEQIAGPLNEKLTRLNTRKAELLLEKEELEDQIKATEDSLCSVMILLSECKSEILDDSIKQINAQGYKGMIAISDTYAPGMDGCITWNEARKLERSGWELCVSTGETTALPRIKKIFDDAGHEFPKTVYYTIGKCDEKVEDIFAQYGFENVIEYGGSVSDIELEKPWRVPGIGSFNQQSLTILKQCINKSEPIVYTIGYEKKEEQYNEANISSMLKQLKEYEDKGALSVTDMDGARIRYTQHMANVSENAKLMQDEYDAIQSQIDEIDAEIAELRNQ